MFVNVQGSSLDRNVYSYYMSLYLAKYNFINVGSVRIPKHHGVSAACLFIAVPRALGLNGKHVYHSGLNGKHVYHSGLNGNHVYHSG